jgi:hypothetical protein
MGASPSPASRSSARKGREEVYSMKRSNSVVPTVIRIVDWFIDYDMTGMAILTGQGDDVGGRGRSRLTRTRLVLAGSVVSR